MHIAKLEKDLRHLVTSGNYDDFQCFILEYNNPSAEEIAKMAEILLSLAQKVELSRHTIDICGTGGDTQIKTTNISSITALKLAQDGIKVVKHAGRAVSSSSGSVDFISFLPTHNLPPDECLQQYNYCFLQAANHHEAYKYIAPFRKQHGKPTVFNMLGPIINPAKPRYRLVGTSFSNIEEYAKAFDIMGFCGAVVQSKSGCDELLSFEENTVIEFGDGKINRCVFNPNEYGIPPVFDDSILGKTPQENFENAMKFLANPEKNTLFYTVAINYAMARKIYDNKFDIRQYLDIIAI
jgi:anthranilate phosphoribosyltransferase